MYMKTKYYVQYAYILLLSLPLCYDFHHNRDHPRGAGGFLAVHIRKLLSHARARAHACTNTRAHTHIRTCTYTAYGIWYMV